MMLKHNILYNMYNIIVHRHARICRRGQPYDKNRLN